MSINSLEPSRRTVARLVATLVLGAALGLMPLAAAADSYDPQKAGHPIRIAAYVLHPIGVLLDTLIMRPAHWFMHQGRLDELFGHES